MATLLLIPRDASLVDVMERELPKGVSLQMVSGGPSVPPVALASHVRMVVVEWPTVATRPWLTTVANVRRRAGSAVPLVAICGSERVAAHAAKHTRRLNISEVVIEEWGASALLIRTMLNDRSKARAGVVAMRFMLHIVPSAGHAILRLVLADGLWKSSVKTVAARLGEDRSTLEEHLREAGGPKPRHVLDLTKSALAVILLRSAREPLKEIAAALGYSQARSLKKMLVRCVGVEPSRIREDERACTPAEYVASLSPFRCSKGRAAPPPQQGQRDRQRGTR